MTSIPKLIMIIGLPGTGKSTFAKVLAKQLGATHLNSDVIRAELGLKGNYTTTAKTTVYQTLQKQARLALFQKRIVIVDATLYKAALRLPYAQLAQQANASIFWIEMQAEEQVIRQRVEKKRPFSEADFSVYQKIKLQYEPLPEIALPLSSDKLSNAAMITKALQFIHHEASTSR